MAGLFVYISKRNYEIPNEQSIIEVLRAISYTSSQNKKHLIHNNLILASVSRIGDNSEKNFTFNEKLDMNCFCEGLFFIESDIKKSIIKKYKMASSLLEVQYLPYLFIEYGEKINSYLSGNYNLVFHLIKKNKIVVINDYLGTLPLFVYEDNEKIIYCSKLSGIAKLLSKVEVDETSILEQLLFNYILSDNTLIKNIQTISNASIIKISQDKISVKKYWGVEELFNYENVSSKKNFDILNSSLSESCNKICALKVGHKAMSLTGGWDSRLILSMIDRKNHKEIDTYSFGATNAPDVKIPQLIADKEGLSYTPYLLDKGYLENDFMNNANDTIVLSNGSRSYKRSHYLYSIKEISKKNRVIITGIFGDQVFKNGKPKGNDVVSQYVIDLIEHNFDCLNIEGFNKVVLEIVKELNFAETVPNELYRRINYIKRDCKLLKNNSEVYAKFRFEYNLRKYFGSEINSYNDFVLSYSPFIEKKFVEEYFKTTYAINRYKFKPATFMQKTRSATLYSKLVKLNYPELAKYSSARGYSMQDTLTLQGNIKILGIRLFKKNKPLDGFNTKKTDSIFIDNHKINDINILNKSNYLSIQYYVNQLKK